MKTGTLLIQFDYDDEETSLSGKRGWNNLVFFGNPDYSYNQED